MFLYLIFFNILLVSSQKSPNFSSNRDVIIHFNEWKWSDIADECERYLQNTSFGGIQISPPTENVIIKGRPWWERYQPVSYNLTTRSGNESQLSNMISRCNKVGIRIYADVILNHMTSVTGTGTAGNKAMSDVKMYPAVPYNPVDFHPTCNIPNYLDPEIVRNCELNNLRDLDQSTQNVQLRIVTYLNKLIGLGVAGFRVDSAKYIATEELQTIYSKLDDLNTSFFPSKTKAFIYQDVPVFDNDVIGNEEYTNLGTVLESRFSPAISRVFTGKDNLTNLQNWGPDWGFISSSDSVVYVDNHSNQRNDRILTYKNLKQYKMAVAFMLAHPYGLPRIISSYFFDNKDIDIRCLKNILHKFNHNNYPRAVENKSWIIVVKFVLNNFDTSCLGPPEDSDENIKSPIIYSDGSCGNGYVCEHRWSQVANMVVFRNVVAGTEIENWWSNEEQQIAFSRGNKGFIAFTNGGNLTEKIQTGLAAGTYCDIISGSLVNKTCSGKSLVVDSKGMATVSIQETDFEGVIAVHLNSKK